MVKPFDLEAAKSGDNVVTRNGKPARIVCFDRVSSDGANLVALVDASEGWQEQVRIYRKSGKIAEGIETPQDLVMAPVKVMRWGLVSQARKRIRLYDTREGAEHAAEELGWKRPLIIPIEWED